MTYATLREGLARDLRQFSIDEQLAISPNPVRWDKLPDHRKEQWYKRVDFILGYLNRYLDIPEEDFPS